MEHRPSMAKVEDSVGISPVRLSVITCRTEVLRVFLKTDFLLGYEISNAGQPLLVSAASHGAIDVAKELLLHCPDAPYENSTTGVTCLHEAIVSEHEEFLNFIICAPQLRALINLRDKEGKTALHHAVLKCRPKLVGSILSHKDIDISILDEEGHSAAWELKYAYSEAKTLEWNEICMLLSKADPRDSFSIHFLQKEARINAVNASRLDSKSLSKTYTSNTAIIATLIATITFAALFTVPGGYSSDPGSAVAFLCVLYRWGDYRFLVHYLAVTKLLMWVSYAFTLVAFTIGMFILLAPHHLWLAILILCCGALVPLATKIVGEWPVLMLMLRSRLGGGPSTYRGQLLDIV
ncbi:unnamed protein product [Triticum turgidum subsp. durum]|nr:unnamed protein product [Triticum turgidum subsp. durum]